MGAGGFGPMVAEKRFRSCTCEYGAALTAGLMMVACMRASRLSGTGWFRKGGSGAMFGYGGSSSPFRIDFVSTYRVWSFCTATSIPLEAACDSEPALCSCGCSTSESVCCSHCCIASRDLSYCACLLVCSLESKILCLKVDA